MTSKAELSAYFSALGKIGGRALAKKKGKEYYAKIGAKGRKARKAKAKQPVHN
jgi:hypothetical protein